MTACEDHFKKLEERRENFKYLAETEDFKYIYIYM